MFDYPGDMDLPTDTSAAGELALVSVAARGWSLSDGQAGQAGAPAPSAAALAVIELAERLTTKARKRHTFTTALAGAGAFPNPARASVLWLGVDGGTTELADLAAAARAAGAKVGGPPDGTRFTPHLTLARPRPPVEATRWLRVLDSYRGPTWEVAEIDLIASYLGEGPSGRPRYETIARAALGHPAAEVP